MPWRARGLDPSAIRTALAGLFGEVEGFDRILPPPGDAGPRRARREIDLTWSGQRVTATWRIHLRGITALHVAVEIGDQRPEAPVGGYRAELPTVTVPLHRLAETSGARLFAGGNDITDAGAGALVDLLTDDRVRGLRPGGAGPHRPKP